MHIKKYNGIEIRFSGPDLHEEEIMSAINYLDQQIAKIDNYPDKSLFFQNPLIIDWWLQLVRSIQKIKKWDVSGNNEDWEERTETYVTYLLTLREYYTQYQHLYKEYYDLFKKLIDGYGGWLDGECISTDGIEAFLEDEYIHDLDDIDDLNHFLLGLNSQSQKTRFGVFSILSDIFKVLLAVMNRGGQTIIDLNPSVDDFIRAIEDDLREWTFSFGKSMFKEMKEDLNRHYKEYRTAPLTPELWGELLNADEEALSKAKNQELSECNNPKQEHWGEDRKKEMDENGKLMQLIYTVCHTEELFNLKDIEDIQSLIALLTPDNLPMFYDIIVRRSIIQCEMYSELKAQHDEWLSPSKGDKIKIPATHEDSGESVNNEKPEEEERFHYIHVEIEDEEAWHIHHAIKRLVANYSIPEICKYLKEQKQNGKLMLPSDSSAMYNELVRLGMPDGKGFSEKNFSNSYTK